MTPDANPSDTGDRRMHRIYAGVIAVEAVVLVGIWLFQRWFGA
jgi:hypothetical protein